MQQSGEQEPFVDEILRLLHRITVDLSAQQVCGRSASISVEAEFQTGSYFLRGGWVYDFRPAQQTTAGEVNREVDGVAKQRCKFFSPVRAQNELT